MIAVFNNRLEIAGNSLDGSARLSLERKKRGTQYHGKDGEKVDSVSLTC